MKRDIEKTKPEYLHVRIRFDDPEDIGQVRRFLKLFKGTMSTFATKPFLKAIDEWEKLKS